MITVIIAGGSGTRLWPLSTHNYPKHLLQLTNDKSLLQNTVERVLGITSADKIFVIPETSHAEHVYGQLTGIDKKNILVEPGRRGTASCFLLGLTEIKRRKLEHEPILFMWADHMVRDSAGFAASMLKAGDIAEAEQKLVFIGVEPSYPSTGLGYLERDGVVKNWQGAYHLMSFKEKPDKRTAQKYLVNGNYLWNTGYLIGTCVAFEQAMKEKSPRLWKDYESLQASKSPSKTYLEFKPEAIDTALSEHITDGIVVPGTFDWSDIGSFKDLHEISAQDDNSNHIYGGGIELENTSNSFVRNDTDTPVAVIGLDNVVVVNTPNGLLVTNKNYAQKVGDVAKRLQGS